MDNNYLKLGSKPSTKYRIICITHSGAYASQYAVLQKYLPDDVECIIYERPGSGARIGEKFCPNWETLIQDAVKSIEMHLDLPYIIFGHSLGGSIAFEVIKELEKLNKATSKYLAIGDREAPNYPPDRMRHHLSDEDFGQMLINDYGMDENIVANSDIMELFLPVLKHDFQLADTYFAKYGQVADKIKTNVVVFRPHESNDTLQSQLDWQNFSIGNFKLVDVPGDHFFVLKQTEYFMKQLLQLFTV